jgi:hypothetical protein
MLGVAIFGNCVFGRCFGASVANIASWRAGVPRRSDPVANRLIKHRVLKRWSAAVPALLAVGLCAQIMPVPYVVSPVKDRSTSYPCMDRPCGCASAEQCWKSCCCFTNQQKVAWATQHAVKIPEYVVTAANKERLTTSPRKSLKCVHCKTSDSVEEQSNDAAVMVETPGLKVVTTTNVAYSETDMPVATPKQSSSNETHRQNSSRYFCGFIALKCRGEGSIWQLLPVSLVPPGYVVNLVGSGLETYLPVSEPRIFGRDRPVPEPPPRLSHVRVCA